MKQLYSALFALSITVFVLGAVVVTTPTAEAACSAQGFISSGGKCAKSFKNANDSVYENRIDALQAYMERLIALIALLEDLRSGSGGSGGGDEDFNIITRSVQNIDDDSATLRGRIEFGDSDEVEVWFEFGTESDDLDMETSKQTRDDGDSVYFSRAIAGLDEDTRYYYRAVGENEDGDRDRGSIMSFMTDEDGNNDDDPTVTTENADEVTDDSAELNGTVDMNDFDDGKVFFVWGEDESQIADVEDDYNTYSDVDEDGDDLQKELVDGNLDGEESYKLDVDGLDNDTDIFYSVCVEYDDGDDQIICGSVEEFTTGDGDGDEPTADTFDATNVDDESARLHGEVDMNDFDNGVVFFVYGTDESDIEDIADDYNEMSDIPDDQDDLDVVEVDSDLDDTEEYDEDVDNLDSSTEYFYAMCVEFENDSNDPELVCGDVERFETD